MSRDRERFVWFSTVQQVVSFDPFQNKFLHVCHFHVRRFRSPRETYICREKNGIQHHKSKSRREREKKRKKKLRQNARETEREEDKPMNQTSISSILVEIRVIIKERNPQSNQMFVKQIRFNTNNDSLERREGDFVLVNYSPFSCIYFCDSCMTFVLLFRFFYTYECRCI